MYTAYNIYMYKTTIAGIWNKNKDYKEIYFICLCRLLLWISNFICQY